MMAKSFGSFGVHTRGGRMVAHTETARTSAPYRTGHARGRRGFGGFGQAAAVPNANCSILNLVQGDGEGSLTQWAPNVTTMQQLLAAAGFQSQLTASGETGTTGVGDDGEFGPDTAAALAAFQASKGLPNSGTVDAATAAALSPGSCTAGLTATSSSSTPLIIGALLVGGAYWYSQKSDKKR